MLELKSGENSTTQRVIIRRQASGRYMALILGKAAGCCMGLSLFCTFMRIDKYLWCIRLYKTRSKATEAVRKERVTVNDELAKPSRKVDPGDVVVCRKQGIAYAYRIKALPKSRVGAKWVPDYAEDQTATEELEKKDFIQLMKKMDRQKGTGRPTKKERRELDAFRQRPKQE